MSDRQGEKIAVGDLPRGQNLPCVHALGGEEADVVRPKGVT